MNLHKQGICNSVLISFTSAVRNERCDLRQMLFMGKISGVGQKLPTIVCEQMYPSIVGTNVLGNSHKAPYP